MVYYSQMVHLYTIGHSNHSLEKLLGLLLQYSIQCVVDVRSHPNSRYNPHFNRTGLEKTLIAAGLEYRWAGDYLGGRRNHPGSLPDESEPSTSAILRDDRFQRGLERLVEIASSKRTCVLCAEEDPSRCHRSFLVARGLLHWPNASVFHIRGDGRLERHQIQEQLGLF